jgi:hypothetical protein
MDGAKAQNLALICAKLWRREWDRTQVSARLISFLGVCAFPPIRKKKANGWGTG